MNLVDAADKSFRQPENRVYYYNRTAENYDIIELILEVDSLAGEETKEFSRQFRGNNRKKQLKRLFDFLKKNIEYEPDGGKERIRAPNALWWEGRGDCKSFAHFIAGVLQNLEIPYAYRFIKQGDNKLYDHVYIVASLGGEEIIIDPVNDHFNEEVNYREKKDYRMDLGYIRGVNKGSGNFYSGYIEYSQMTEGELRLYLLGKQYELIASNSDAEEFYGPAEKLKGLLEKGIHELSRFDSIRGIIRESGREHGAFLERQISEAMQMDYPAVMPRKFIPKGGIGQVNCEELLPDVQAFRDCIAEGGSVQEPTAPEGFTLEEVNTTERILNQHLAPSAHHLLYAFAQVEDLTSPVSAKRVLHNNAIGAISEAAGLSEWNIRQWLRNGVIEGTIKQPGGQAMQPEQAIKAVRQAADEGIGGITVAAVLAVLKAVSIAIAAAATLVQAFKASKTQKIKQAAQGIGTPSFGPEKIDFQAGFPGDPGAPGVQPPTQGGQIDWLPIALVGGGLLLLK